MTPLWFGKAGAGHQLGGKGSSWLASCRSASTSLGTVASSLRRSGSAASRSSPVVRVHYALFFPFIFAWCGDGATVTHPDLPSKCLQDGLMFDLDKDKEAYEYVCCDNSRYAEHKGFLDKVQFFDKIADWELPITFFDSGCGIPLFKAPVGRSFDEWKMESVKHGWPSFRDGEVVTENVVEVGHHGEVLSTCGTHLGHNLPDPSGNRYCINLICMAGNPPISVENVTSATDAAAVGLGASKNIEMPKAPGVPQENVTSATDAAAVGLGAPQNIEKPENTDPDASSARALQDTLMTGLCGPVALAFTGLALTSWSEAFAQ